MNKDTSNIQGQIRLVSHRLSKFGAVFTRFLNSIGLNRISRKYVELFGTLNWDTGFFHNIITNAGKAQIALLAGSSATPFTYLAVGTSNTAVAATDTALTAEISTSGLSRASATVSRITTTVTNDTLQLVYTWTATGTVSVEEIGVFNAASTGTMLGHALTTTKALSNTDTLTATYQVKFS